MKPKALFLSYYFIAIFITQVLSLYFYSLGYSNNTIIKSWNSFGFCLNRDYSDFLGKTFYLSHYNFIYIIVSLILVLSSLLSLSYMLKINNDGKYTFLIIGLLFCSIGLSSNSLNLYTYNYVINYFYIHIGKLFIATNMADILMYIGGFFLIGSLMSILVLNLKSIKDREEKSFSKSPL